MDWLARKMPRIFVWLGFGILFAVLPLLILGGMKLVDRSWDAAADQLKTALAQGDSLLVVAAILADSIGRLMQDVVTHKPPALVGLKLSFAIVMACVAATCGMAYVRIFSNLHSMPIQTVNAGVGPASAVFFCLAFVFGFIVILMVED